MIKGTVGHFEVLDPLGAGAMGIVYRARDPRLRRDVAIKVLRHDDRWSAEARGRLLREARAISALNHPNICTVHDIDDRDGQTFIVMELVAGSPLSTRVTPRGVDPETVARWGAELAAALEHAHEHGVVHRDLKPSNVVVSREGRVKIVDFGIAARLPWTAGGTETALTKAPGGGGTPPYMAPEVLDGGSLDARSDIWSLGVVLHELLSGSRPFPGQTSQAVAAAILRDPPAPLPSHVPSELAAIVRRCLTKDPAVRYQRAGEVRAALEAVQARPGAWRRTGVTRRTVLLAAAMVLACLCATAAATRPLWLTTWIGSVSAPSTLTPQPAAIRSLGVLPLKNLAGDGRPDYFADGMTSALITELTRLDSLDVISQASSMRYRDAGSRPRREIGRELGVDALIEGSVLRVGDRVRIDVDLIDARTDRHVWADSYDRPVDDVLDLQAAIARDVAGRVRTRLGPAANSGSRPNVRVDPKAYELYLRGEFDVLQVNPAAIERAVRHYEQALAIDPGFALAYAGLAGAKFAREFGGGAAFRTNTDQIRQALSKALALDPQLADAHVMLGRVALNYDWDYAGAEAAFTRAIALGPGLAVAHEAYSVYLQTMGRFEEGVLEAERAVRLDPRSSFMLDNHGRTLYRARRYQQAEERFRQALAIDPGFQSAHARLIQLCIAQRRWEEARTTLSRLEQLPSSNAARVGAGLRAWLEAASGNAAAAHRFVARVRADRGDYERARVFVALGEHDRAFAELETALRKRSIAPYTWSNPEFDPLRADARFASLLQRVGLPVDRLVQLK